MNRPCAIFLLSCGLPIISALATIGAERNVVAADLGDLTGYDSATQAKKTCQGEPVVWADRESGFFRKGTGTFACIRAVMTADYWDNNPFASPHHRGREFPINPDLLCKMCS